MNALRAVLLGTTALLSGCTSGSEIAKDLGEIFHVNGAVGIGAHAHAGIGDLLHAGAGVQFCYQYGWAYGSAEEWLYGMKGQWIVLHFEGGAAHVGGSRSCWQTPACSHCFALLPVLTNKRIRTWMHRFDLDIEVFAGFVGVGIGFSPGEFVDFFTSLFGWDLDPEKPEGMTEWESGIPSPLYPPSKSPETPPAADESLPE